MVTIVSECIADVDRGTRQRYIPAHGGTIRHLVLQQRACEALRHRREMLLAVQHTTQLLQRLHDDKQKPVVEEGFAEQHHAQRVGQQRLAGGDVPHV
jgi:shikimate kinase